MTGHGGTGVVRGRRCRRPRLYGCDRGAGTVLVVGLVAVVVSVTAALGLLVRAQAGRGIAQAAADLGALAAAASVAVPAAVRLSPDAAATGAACGLAARVVERNGATLAACTSPHPGVVQVTAHRATVLGTARATARAGPASARSP